MTALPSQTIATVAASACHISRAGSRPAADGPDPALLAVPRPCRPLLEGDERKAPPRLDSALEGRGRVATAESPGSTRLSPRCTTYETRLVACRRRCVPARCTFE